jgi:Lrp/AsnC family leucine-responsive transcriptional regulator
MALDRIDAKILTVLQSEGRISMIELANRVGLSATPTQRRVQKLEQDGYIKGFGARFDRRKLGLGLTVFLMLKVEGHHQKNADVLLKRLNDLPEVVSCHVISGDADILAEAVVQDLAAYEELLMGTLLKLGMIKEIRSSIAIRTIKSDGALPIQPS